MKTNAATPPGLRLEEFSGPDLGPWLDALGALRIAVFRDFPYLYDGSLEYERDYLATYLRSATCRVVLALTESDELVGATTCVALEEEIDAFKAPFVEAGIDPGKVLYFGESIVLPEWRGRGLGREFFVRREAHARRLRLPITAFCAVDRPAGHPLCPPGYRPLDPFWQRLGYTRQPGMRAVLGWKEIGEASESPKALTFWTKGL